ncbi:MAG TPA: hypothetical protein VJN95_17285 [Gemmatimonadales bacterium]|nr:hypothetical protein [Gemmatimonadales bacterium]
MNRNAAIAALLLAILPAPAAAQYFGQNRVQYGGFDFKIIETEHFEIHYYEETRAAALDAARIAERSYARLSKVLGHQFKARKPIILYASHAAFQQTNALGDSPDESTEGVTDFYRHRMVLPFFGSYAYLEHVIQHEMVHQFQYDIWSRGNPGAGLTFLMQLNPPGWFVEGMAEYLSTGPLDPTTAMWLRDAALEGNLPTIEQLERDPRVFPYRYGQAILTYIGERWGDEVIGTIMRATLAGGGGLNGAFRRATGITLNELSDQWRDYVQKKYLPEIANREKARMFSQAVLTEKKSQGSYHLAPGLSPDGTQIAFFSERHWVSFDLYLADAMTGRVEKRLLKSTYSGSYESFQFIQSSVNWSPDGKFITVAAKRGPRDRILIIDVKHNDVAKEIEVPLEAVTSPSFSPDGKQLVFTGQAAGFSDLFTVNVDGTGFRRLTDDKYADFEPAWSPDGKTIAFSTDRGPETDFTTLRIGNLRIALYHLDSGTIELLPQMESGKNINPQWAPDGQSLAFASDRNGVSNIYLADLTDHQVYPLTDLYTGVQGITYQSPVLSWATGADKLAFIYYEKGDYDIYAVSNPRALRRPAWHPPTTLIARDGTPIKGAPESNPPAIRPLAQAADEEPVAPSVGATPAPLQAPTRDTTESTSGTLYRTPEGFRHADAAPTSADSALPPPVSIAALMESTTVSMPDTSEFLLKPYKVHYSIEYLARPTLGYTRDNFGGGLYGGSTIVFGDMLGDHNLVFSAYINGRIGESLIEAGYINRAHRLNYSFELSQVPYYNLLANQVVTDQLGNASYVENVERLIIRGATATGYYPLSRFQRLEGSLQLANVDDAVQRTFYPYDPASGALIGDPNRVVVGIENISIAAPNLAIVYDNTLNGWVGPVWGHRYRLGITQTLGGWNFTTLNADYRQYFRIAGPLAFAVRGQYFGQIGASASNFQVFLGRTDLLRGNTSGSYQRNECRFAASYTPSGICAPLYRMVGTQIGIGSAELRFPLLNAALGFLPVGFPPIEGALFYDVGIAWDGASVLKWNRSPGDDPLRVRTPSQTLGVSARMNVFGFVILRLDWSVPQERPGMHGLWTLSIGPTW